MTISRVFACITLVYLLGFFSHALYLQKTVYGDGIYYYSWLRSAVFDHNLNFRNEYAHFGVNQPLTDNGLLANKYSIGPALLWLPSFLLVNTAVQGDGYELPYQLAVGLSSVFYGLFGLLLLERFLLKFFSPRVGLLTIIVVSLATNLFFYGSIDTVNSHALSFFAVMLFLNLLLSEKKNWLAIGLALGLVGSIRMQDIVYGIALVPFIHRKTIPYFAIGLGIMLLLQLIVWQIVYGSFTVSPYLSGGEGFNFASPHILEVLFSLQNGLFLFSPILLLGSIGLFFWKNSLRQYSALVLLLELLLVSSWSTWSQGASYSGRMFVSTLPIFAIGIASVFQRLMRHGWNEKLFLFIFIAPLSSLNFLLMFFFLLAHP